MLSGAAARRVLAYALLCVALTVHSEQTLPLSLGLMLASLWLLFRPAPEDRPLGTRAVAVVLGLLYCLSLVHPPGEPPRRPSLVVLYYLLMLAVLLVALRAVRRPSTGAGTLALLLGLYVAAGLLRLHLCPAPRIDVFHLQQMGARELLAGRDPYAAVLPNTIYSPEETRAFFGDDRQVLTSYPYPPLTLLGTLPAYLLGDVRLLYLALQSLCALLLHALARPAGGGRLAVLLAALHLVHPRGLFVVEQAWTEPAMAAAVLGLLLLLRRGGITTGGVALGLVLSAKQYSVVLAPLLLARRLLPRAVLLVGIVVAVALNAPFLLWHPAAFLDDVILFQLRQPFRMDALSVPAALAQLSGVRLPGALAPLLGLGVAAWAARRTPRLAQAMALVLLCFFLAAKQAFCNYYYLVGVLVLAAVAEEGVASPSPPGVVA